MRKMLVSALALTLAFAAASPGFAQNPNPAPRKNAVIKLLEEGKPVFSIWANYIGVGSDHQAAVSIQGNKNFDFVLYDQEHNPLDINNFGQFLRNLVDPYEVAKYGVSVIKPVIVRIPPNGREIRQNEWMIKQILDQGGAGIMFPYIETPQMAIDALKVVRYPQRAGYQIEPAGLRGTGNWNGARHWGMTAASGLDYELAADVWGMGPQGDTLLIFIIESKLGVENVREIAKAIKAQNAKVILWAGGGDLDLTCGHDPKCTEDGLQKIVAAGKEFGLPVGMNGTRDFQKRYDQGFRVFFDIGPAALGNGPQLTPEQRKAVGR